jgi:hypothetical protein
LSFGPAPPPLQYYQQSPPYQQQPPYQQKQPGIGTGIKIGIGIFTGFLLMMGACGFFILSSLDRGNQGSNGGMSRTPATAPVRSSDKLTPEAPSKTLPDASKVPARTEPFPGVTLENFGRLKDGMTYPEVVKILGKEGTEISSSNIAGYKTVMYQWEGQGFGNMNAMFQNGKLVSKAQFGLK